MAEPLIITADRTETVVLSDNTSSVTLAENVTIQGPTAAGDTFGIDATNGAGGLITVFGSIIGNGGIYDVSTARAAYDVTIQAQGSITALTGFGIAFLREARVINHGTISAISANKVGISIGAGNSFALNDGVIEAYEGIRLGGDNSVAVNAGIVQGLRGIQLVGANETVVNSGTIETGTFGIRFLSSVLNSVNTLTNTGSIVAGTYGVYGQVGAERIVNHGSIMGLIDLNDGNDIVDTRLGTINGLIILGTGNDTGLGGAGNETFADWTGDDSIDAGGGIDTLSYETYAGTDRPLTVDLTLTTAQATGWGNDTLLNIENIVGTQANDTLTGDDKDNQFTGRDGNDVLRGGRGNDTLIGGAGTDSLDGGDGSDTVIIDNNAVTIVDLRVQTPQDTGQGYDILIGIENVISGSWGDILTGNAADNRLVGNGGSDLLSGDAGNDTLDGGADADNLFGDLGNDFLTGGSGNDALSGGDGNDTLDGGADNDILMGGAGNDYLIGGTGNDRLVGSAGKDVLTGGAGQDIFVFDTKPSTLTNIDRITDFSVADDTIYLSRKIFSKITKSGILAKDAFYAGAKAHDTSDRIIYSKTTGKLYYDDDGTGAHAAVQIAQLAKGLKVSAADFLVF